MEAIGLGGLIDAWLDEKQTIGRGLSLNSESAYRRDLEGWAWRIAELNTKPPADRHVDRLGIADLTADNVRKALASLAREQRAPASRSRMLAALRGFCGWLVRSGHLIADPTLGLQNPAQPERLPVAFLGTELKTILETVSEPDPTARQPWPERDRALVAVLAGAGLRASEAVELTIASVARDDPPLLRVIGKGNKERRVPVSDEVLEAVDGYLATRTPAPTSTDRLFVRPDGKPFTREGLNYHVVKWLKRAGVRKPDGEAAHAFRHTYAKGLVAQGVPISTVQQLLGHRSLDTTAIYLRMTGAELGEAAKAAEINRFLREVPNVPA